MPRKFKYLIRTRHGTPYRQLSLAGIVRDAGLRGVTPHTLKRTAMEYAHQMRVGVMAASKMLGTTPETLLGYYTDWEHLREGTAKGAYDDRAARRRLRTRKFTGPEPDDRVRNRDRPYKPRRRKPAKPVA